jgi:hypothetical protein
MGLSRPVMGLLYLYRLTTFQVVDLYLHLLNRNMGNDFYRVPDCDSNVCSIIAYESAFNGNL